MTTFAEELSAPEDYLPGIGSAAPPVAASADFETRVGAVIDFVEASGLVFEPWQVAAYVTAIRTKPFVILAGISGTGKTRLPRLVAEATGAEFILRPVRPDWTDSSDLLGYEDLQGDFTVGRLLVTAHEATQDPAREFFFCLDEMNLARVEYYFAEILSLIEERRRTHGAGITSQPLVPNAPKQGAIDWATVGLSGNLAIVGSVNMDEASHGFSRKVLDRAFTLEFSDVDLALLPTVATKATIPWPVEDWQQPMLSLAEADPSDSEISRTVSALQTLNQALSPVQLQVGYRVRDEVAMFCINARDAEKFFVTRQGDQLDPLDLAIAMKVLPRIQGGTTALRSALDDLGKWAQGAKSAPEFPYCLERLELMRDRLASEGFTSYWL